jgi:hypothetical protein
LFCRPIIAASNQVTPGISEITVRRRSQAFFNTIDPLPTCATWRRRWQAYLLYRGVGDSLLSLTNLRLASAPMTPIPLVINTFM